MPWYQVISTWITVILGTVAFDSLTMGYFLCGTTVLEWIICAVATLLLFFPHILPWAIGFEMPTLIIDVMGIGLWVVVYFMQKIRIAKDPSLTKPLEERKALKKAAAASAL